MYVLNICLCPTNLCSLASSTSRARPLISTLPSDLKSKERERERERERASNEWYLSAAADDD